MTARSPRTTTALAGAVGALVPALLLLTWYVVVERATCTTTGVLDCIGPAVGVYAIGVPLTYLAYALALRRVGVRSPWLVPLGVGTVIVQVAPVLGRVGFPPSATVLLTGALTAGWAAFTGQGQRLTNGT